MKTGILGGTFNPPHYGHDILGKCLYSQMGLDRVLVIPDGFPPHKTPPFLASDEDRAQMCRYVFTDSIYTIDMLETYRSGRSFTIDTLKALKDKYPDDEFYLAVGSDMLMSFHTWSHPQQILDSCTVCAASRKGTDSEKLMISYCNTRYKQQFENGRIRILSCEPLVISSSALRDMIKRGDDMHDYMPGSEINYIKERGLYK
jgi:nicotinate-nucleotide adenylyltransferase